MIARMRQRTSTGPGSRLTATWLMLAPWLAVSAVLAPRAAAQDTSPAGPVGPAHGTLVIAGGGRLGPEILNRFIQAAGGPEASIVVIPTAGEGDTFGDDYAGLRLLRSAGAHNLTILHTRERDVANSESFVKPLRDASGVWIVGGRQWRLADAYLGTSTLRELNALLDRGGVIGGTSAGASIQASYMVRGAVEGNTIMMAPGHERGFDLLHEAAVDQHLIARNREQDMLQVIAHHPDLLGIGLDEGTAIVVRGDSAQVIGRSLAAFYNTADAGAMPYYFLRSGDAFDLADRRTLHGERLPPRAADEHAVLNVVDRLFNAMRTGDSAAVRRLFQPDARLIAVGGGGEEPPSVTGIDEFVRTVAGAPAGSLDERAVAPQVRVDGRLASVWTPYELRRDGAFSHCGIDAFHLLRMDGQWRIVDIVYTVRKEGCQRR